MKGSFDSFDTQETIKKAMNGLIEDETAHLIQVLISNTILVYVYRALRNLEICCKTGKSTTNSSLQAWTLVFDGNFQFNKAFHKINILKLPGNTVWVLLDSYHHNACFINNSILFDWKWLSCVDAYIPSGMTAWKFQNNKFVF